MDENCDMCTGNCGDAGLRPHRDGNSAESKAIRLYVKNTAGKVHRRCVVAEPKSSGRKAFTDRYAWISKVTVTNTCSG